MNRISIICVYNNKIKLNEMIESVKEQESVEVEFVLLDNTNNKFTSAAQALNFGVRQASCELYVFIHQDVVFLDTKQLLNIYNFAINNRNTIFGSAGVQQGRNDGILSNMYEGDQRYHYNTLKSPEKCFTLDECIIACYKDCLNSISFDEIVCDGWHLYGADLCLQANLVKSLSVMVIPMNIWHKSHGNADKSYYITQTKLAKKYIGKYSIINTTNGYIYTNFIKRIILGIYRKFKYRF